MVSKSWRRTHLVYQLYMIGAILCLPMFVGVVIASKEKAANTDSILLGHLNKQFRIFWMYLSCIFGGTLVVLFIFPVYLGLLIPLRGAREADPEITVVLAIFPPLIFIALVLLGAGTYVLISSIIGFRKLVAEQPNLEYGVSQ